MAENYSFRLKIEPLLSAKHLAFPFQEEAVNFVAEREFSAIFHEQGLGKTKIAIDVGLKWLRSKEIDTVLIFTKKGLIANWLREFSIHTHTKPFVLTESGKSNYYVFTTPVRLVLAHYEVAKKEEKRLRAWLRTRRVAVFLDESVKIKNPEAALTEAFFRLAPDFRKRVIMTGTPAANRPFDVWAQIFFLDQGAALGNDYKQFRSETDLPANLHGDEVAQRHYRDKLSAVHANLNAIAVRETKDGGRISLPTKEFVRIDCRWEASQFEMYRQVREDLRAVIQRDGKIIEESQDAILKRLLRLIQIAAQPAAIDESYHAEPGKFLALYDLISDITRAGEKAIVFTHFNFNAEWLKKQLAPFGALCLNGRMAMDARNNSVKWFLENADDKVLVATTGAAKEGLTLTVANHVIFYDRSYSLDDYLQAQDRIHRVSQTRKCFVYNLIMQDSIDEWIDALIEQKKLAAQLTQGDISGETYTDLADFSFTQMLQGILSAPVNGGG
ncbi:MULTISPECIES: DEAD/DEAH box helicase [unclassified Mesorhizobium]|uniref:DEAD/DEAH box helicase n=1 Tax=unclassified Mesorhizobium TaxID=325217 RepID=UPI00112E13BC|nr:MULTISPECIES: DEAD/DEAH box helicase [unclassified Mesorhizobium]TPM06135.1 DEAD/DEAH box helicase [Mesorhizobium sp. B2-3-8]TPM13868.1 DEAD/DEAH box helicase [Mesorhizobium sp. B2-3-7]